METSHELLFNNQLSNNHNSSNQLINNKLVSSQLLTINNRDDNIEDSQFKWKLNSLYTKSNKTQEW